MKRTPTSRTEALALIAKRQQSRLCPSEEHLQIECVKAFAEKYPEKRGRLFATFQNPSIEQYGLWIAKGFVPGVSDLIYINDDYKIIGIELKQKGKRHSMEHLRRQMEWMRSNCHRYGFITSLSEFWDIIEGRNDEIFRIIFEKLEKYSAHSYTF